MRLPGILANKRRLLIGKDDITVATVEIQTDEGQIFRNFWKRTEWKGAGTWAEIPHAAETLGGAYGFLLRWLEEKSKQMRGEV